MTELDGLLFRFRETLARRANVPDPLSMTRTWSFWSTARRTSLILRVDNRTNRIRTDVFWFKTKHIWPLYDSPIIVLTEFESVFLSSEPSVFGHYTTEL